MTYYANVEHHISLKKLHTTQYDYDLEIMMMCQVKVFIDCVNSGGYMLV